MSMQGTPVGEGLFVALWLSNTLHPLRLKPVCCTCLPPPPPPAFQTLLVRTSSLSGTIRAATPRGPSLCTPTHSALAVAYCCPSHPRPG